MPPFALTTRDAAPPQPVFLPDPSPSPVSDADAVVDADADADAAPASEKEALADAIRLAAFLTEKRENRPPSIAARMRAYDIVYTAIVCRRGVMLDYAHALSVMQECSVGHTSPAAFRHSTAYVHRAARLFGLAR